MATQIKQIKKSIRQKEFNPNAIKESISHNVDGTFIVQWNKSNLLLDIYKENYIEHLSEAINTNQLIEARIFNPVQEIRIFQRMKQWIVTEILEQEGESTEYFDSEQIVSGKRALSEENGVIPLLQMGMKTPIGKSLAQRLGIHPNTDLKTPIILVTRNYITPNEIGQYGITLTRMVEIKK